MKIKVFVTLVFVVVTVLAGYHSNTKNGDMSFLNFSLSTLESIASCEVSPNHSENKGYCSYVYGGSGGSCVTTGSGSEPRCSGNN